MNSIRSSLGEYLARELRLVALVQASEPANIASHETLARRAGQRRKLLCDNSISNSLRFGLAAAALAVQDLPEREPELRGSSMPGTVITVGPRQWCWAGQPKGFAMAGRLRIRPALALVDSLETGLVSAVG